MFDLIYLIYDFVGKLLKLAIDFKIIGNVSFAEIIITITILSAIWRLLSFSINDDIYQKHKEMREENEADKRNFAYNELKRVALDDNIRGAEVKRFSKAYGRFNRKEKNSFKSKKERKLRKEFYK